MKEIKVLGTDRGVGLSAFEDQPLQREIQGKIGVVQKCDQSENGTVLQKFRYAVLTGNIQDQISLLLGLYESSKIRRQKMGIRVLSRSQFLEGAQRFLKSQGLVLDKTVRKSCYNKLQHN